MNMVLDRSEPVRVISMAPYTPHCHGPVGQEVKNGISVGFGPRVIRIPMERWEGQPSIEDGGFKSRLKESSYLLLPA